jgi:hypothetical protein
MILGRPTNLIVGAFVAVFGAVVVVLAALTPPVLIPSAVVGAVTGAFGALVLLVANQAPTLNPGDTFNVKTPEGQPNYQTTVATPPKADPPPKPKPEG